MFLNFGDYNLYSLIIIVCIQCFRVWLMLSCLHLIFGGLLFKTNVSVWDLVIQNQFDFIKCYWREGASDSNQFVFIQQSFFCFCFTKSKPIYTLSRYLASAVLILSQRGLKIHASIYISRFI